MLSLLSFLAIVSSFLSLTTSAFSGNFELTNLVVSCPFQADPTSTNLTYVEFDICDQDTPEIEATRCGVAWAVGLEPPTWGVNTCDNTTFIVTVTAWHGVGNLSLMLGHQYIDNSVGQAPYNVLSKYSYFNATYPDTEYYECDMDKAECSSCEGEMLIANVTSAVA